MRMHSQSPKSGAKSRTEIAWMYGISTRTLMRRLKKLNIKLPPGLIFPADQQRIYEVLGSPEAIIHAVILYEENHTDKEEKDTH